MSLFMKNVCRSTVFSKQILADEKKNVASALPPELVTVKNTLRKKGRG